MSRPSPRQVRAAISLTGQYAAVDAMLSGRENLVMMARLRHLPRLQVRTRVDELLDQFDLRDAADRRVSTYSGGMRRRIDLAMSLISVPTVLFLDEPTTGLDPRSRHEVWDAVEELAGSGVTVLLTTQYLDEADRLADRIAVIDGGRLVAEGTPTELKAGVGSETVQLFFGSTADLWRAESLLAEPGAPEPLRDDAAVSLRVAADGTADAVRRLLDRLSTAGIPAVRLTLHEPTLDEVFLHLTEQPGRHRRRPHPTGEDRLMATLTAPHVTAPPRSPASTLLSDGLVFVGRSVRHDIRSLDAMMMALVLPLVILLMFVYVFGGAIDTTGGYINYVVPGIILLCAGFGAAGASVSVALDMTTGVIDRFRSLPIVGGCVLVGHVVATVLQNLVATLVVLGVALAIGFRPHADVLDWLGVAGLLILFMSAIAWLAACFGLVAKSVEGANAFAFIVMFLPYLSSAFVPTDTMPRFLRGVASHQPVTPVIETLRGLMMGTPIGNTWIVALAWCVGGIVLGSVGAALLFSRRTAR